MKIGFIAISTLVLAGCSNIKTDQNTAKQPDLVSALYATPAIPGQRSIAQPEAFQPAKFAVAGGRDVNPYTKSVTIQHYVRGLVQEMVISMQDVTEQTSVAVASFVYLDSDFNDASLISNQISESFMHELHTFGVTVLDFKLTDYIRVTPQGDFVHSRDYEELSGNLNANYALGGTLSRHKEGIIVNARLVNFSNKAIVASAQSLIPNKVVNALIPNQTLNRMPLLKDEN